MRKIIICLLTLLALTTATAYAGAGHSHGPTTPVTQVEAVEKATGLVKNFVNKGKLESSWVEVTPATAEQKRSKFGPEWVVTFNNPKVEGKAKQTLYVFLSLGGDYKAANFSGS